MRKLVLVALVFGVRCSRPTPTIELDAAGGVVLPRLGEPNISIRVPPNAVTSPTAVAFRPLTERPAGAVGPAIEATPHGAVFREPVALRFSPTAAELAPGIAFSELKVATLTKGRWELLPTSFPAPGVIEGLTGHFSTFALVAPCHVSGTGQDFPLTQCPTFTPRVQTSSPASLEVQAASVTLSIRVRPLAGAGTTTLTVSGLRAGWTYQLVRDGSGQQQPMTATASGTLTFAQDVASAHSLVLMAQHGSVFLSASTCSGLGTWNASTRTCTLTQDLVDPPVWLEENDFTLDCAGHLIGGTTRQSIGIYFNGRANIRVRNCTISNVDTGLQGAASPLEVSAVAVRNPGTVAYGSAGLSLGGANDVTVSGTTVERFSQGMSFGGSNVQVSAATFRGCQVPVFLEGASGVLLDGLQLDPADVPSPTNVLAAVLFEGSTGRVRNLATTGRLDMYGSVIGSVFDSAVEVERAAIDSARVAVRLDGPRTSVVSDSTFSNSEVTLLINGGLAHVFHNNFLGNHSHSVVATAALELSDTRPASPTFQQGNFWGRACPSALFDPAVDATNATDSFPYPVASAWSSGGTPGCAANPPLAAPVLTSPTAGALLKTATPSFQGSSVPGALVEVFEGTAVRASGTAGAAGAFSLPANAPLAQGPHTVSARASLAGQTSPSSAPLVFSIDSIAPAAPSIAFPTPGATLFDTSPFVLGNAEPSARLDLFLDGSSSSFGSVTSAGAFSIRLVAVEAGTHVLTARAIDAAGNASAPSTPLAFSASRSSVGQAGRLRLTSIADFPDAFEASAGESNTVAVAGDFVRPNGSGGPNVQYALFIQREVMTASTLALVRTLTSQLTLVGDPAPVAASLAWNGRDGANQLVAAGAYVSKTTFTAVRTSNGSNNVCLTVTAQGCVVDTATVVTSADVASAPLLARPPAVAPTVSVAGNSVALVPAQGRVIVLPEAAFTAALTNGSAVPASIEARRTAVALAGTTNDARFVGVAAELQLTNTPTSFSGDVFVVARGAGTSGGGRFVETNDFFVASVSLTGTSPWVGTGVRLGASATGPAASSNCCGPQRVCASDGPSTGPCGNGSTCVPPDTKAVPNDPNQPTGNKVAIYGSPTATASVLPSTGYTCTGSLFPGCTVAAPVCDPNAGQFQLPGQGNGGTTGNGQCVPGLLGRDVPPICTVILSAGTLPSECGGYCPSCEQPTSAWWSQRGIQMGCPVSKPGPGSNVCRERTEADRQMENMRGQLAVEESGCAKAQPVAGKTCCGSGCFCEAATPAGGTTPSGVPRPQVVSCTRCNGDECQKFSQGTPGVGLVEGVVCVNSNGAVQCTATPNPPTSNPAPAQTPPPATTPPPGPAGPAPTSPPVKVAPGSAPSSPGTAGGGGTTGGGGTAGGQGGGGGSAPSPHPHDPLRERDMVERPAAHGRPEAVMAPSNKPGDPVLVGDGSFELHETDFSFPGIARPLEFSRAYNSRSTERGTLGSNWTHNWDVHLEVIREGTRPSWAPLYCGSTPARDMCVLLYDPQRGSQLFALDYASGLYLPQAGSTDTVARTRIGSWALRRSNGDILLFDADGYLVSDRDRFGNGFLVEQEDTPLHALFKLACRSEAPLTTTHALWPSCAVLAGLLREGAMPESESLAWAVTAAQLAVHPATPPAEKAAADYGRAQLLFLISGRTSTAVPYGARKKRPTRVTDDLGRELTFTYFRAPPLGQGFDFAGTPEADLLQRVRGPAGVQLAFEYEQPPNYPPELQERFLTRMTRTDAPPNNETVAAPTRTMAFKYQWPGTAAPLSWPAFEPAVLQKHAAYFATFTGCLYRDTYTCGKQTAQGAKFVRAAGSPLALARAATNDFVSDIADNIIKVTHAGVVESETRYGTDPFTGSFDRALAQRYGSRGAVQNLARLPADVAGANWEEPTLPRAAFDYVEAGPAATGDATDAFLPQQLKTRFALEAAVLPTKTHGGPFKPLGANGNPPRGPLCDGTQMEVLRGELPGFVLERDYFDLPTPLTDFSALKRSVLSCRQLALAQTEHAAHNDLLSDLQPLTATPDPDDYLPTLIRNQRTHIAANNNRICAWTRFVDRDGDTTFFGLNYRGQVLVHAIEDRGQPGAFLVTETLYTADGLVRQQRRPTRGASPWTSAAGHTLYTYDEVDPTGNGGWNQWLPAYWTRRANVLDVTEYPATGSVTDVAEAAGAAISTTTARFTRMLYEPLFNQLWVRTEGSLNGTNATVHRTVDFVFDYQELDLRGPDFAPLLTGLEDWGFRWLHDAQPPADYDFTRIASWQIQPPFLDDDVNRDGVRGFFSRTTQRPAAGLPVLMHQRAAAPSTEVVTTTLAWAAHGQPALVTTSEGAATYFDYYEVGPGQYGASVAPTSLTASPVNVGLLARFRTKRFRDPQPAIAGLSAAPCPALAGPYQWLLDAACTNPQGELTTLGLPPQVVQAVLASKSTALTDGWRTKGFTYSELGRPRVEWGDTAELRQILDTDGRTVEHVDALGSTTRNTWSARAFLASTRKTSSSGVLLGQSFFSRDDEGRATCICTELKPGGCGGGCNPLSSSATAAVTQVRFTPEGDEESQVDPEGLQTVRTYDERKQLTREAQTDPADGTTRTRVWEYSDDGDVVHVGFGPTAAAPRGVLGEDSVYDGLQRLKVFTDRRGYEWQLGHSSRDVLSLVERGPEWRTRFRYDGFERLVERVDNEAITTTFTRTPAGLVAASSQTGFGPTYATYDVAGRLVWQRDAAGTDTVFTFRPSPHEVTSTTVRRGASGARLVTATISALNAAGQPLTTTEFGSGLTRSSSLQRDGNGDVREATDAEGLKSQVDRNLLGWAEVVRRQRTRTSVTDWETTTTAFSRRGEPTGVEDGNGFATAVFYNAFGDVRRREVPFVAPVTFAFDALGRRTTRSSGAGTVRSLYDARGDNWRDEQVTGTGATPLVTRNFDGLGRLLGVSHSNAGLTALPAADRLVASAFAYDAAGRLASETRVVGGGPSHTFASQYSVSAAGTWQRDTFSPLKAWREDFDAAGRLVGKRRYSGPTLAPTGMTFAWLGDLPAGRTQAQGRPSPLRQAVARDGFGVPTGWTYSALDLSSAGAPVDAAEGAAYCSGAWDPAVCASPLLQLDAVRDVVGRAGSVQWKFSDARFSNPTARAKPWRGYTYSALGRVEQSLEHAGVGSSISTAALVGHALAAADVEAAGATAEQWQYERTPFVGSPTGVRNAQSGAYRWKVTQPRAGYALTGLEVDGVSRAVQHDTDGRVVADGSRAFRFDVLDALVEVQANGQGLEQYAYDGLGRLTAVFQGGTAPTSTFVHDGSHFVAAYSAAGQRQWEAVWGPGQDVLLEWVDAAGAHLPLVDHRNSVVASWDVAPGTLSDTAEYTPEGRLTVHAPGGSLSCQEEGTGALCAHPAGMPFGFGSAWRSPVTGLVHLRARWYSPPLGQFLSTDPVGYVDSFNLYAYAGFDPINRSDPFGLQSPECTPQMSCFGHGTINSAGEVVEVGKDTVVGAWRAVPAPGGASLISGYATTATPTAATAVPVMAGIVGRLLFAVGVSAVVTTSDAEATAQNLMSGATYRAPGRGGAAVGDPGFLVPVQAPIPRGAEIAEPSEPDAMEAAKRGPKPGWKGEHNQTIKRRIGEIREEHPDWTHIGGKGSQEPEVIIKTPDPEAKKGSRRMDISHVDPTGKVHHENVGRVDRFGNPIPREQDALDDVQRETGTRPRFTPWFPKKPSTQPKPSPSANGGFTR